MKKFAFLLFSLFLLLACQNSPNTASELQTSLSSDYFEAEISLPAGEENFEENFDVVPPFASQPSPQKNPESAWTTGLPPDQEIELEDGTHIWVGFKPTDPYTGIDQACLDVTKKLVPPKWRIPVLDWCEHRGYHSSRNTKIESRVDGSWIHDRDRPTAWLFYNRGRVSGNLDPDNCVYHAIDKSISHPKPERALAQDCKLDQKSGKSLCWNFKSPRMTDKLRNQWMSHFHDMERFGARGPIDWNANAFYHLKGCWDPASLDRYDVSAVTTVVASLKICARHGCQSKWDIKQHWGR
jgi:hypothetical protein